MKLFLSEYRHDYQTYTFGYTIYAIYQQPADLNELYAQGFLPYTGNINLDYDLFYKSRGIRVDLKSFKDSSENRRVNRKVIPLQISLELIPISEFNSFDQFYEFAKDYSEERIGEDKMPEDRIQYIINRSYLSHILVFKSGDRTLAYILAMITDQCFHYWFSFYDTSYLEKNIPLGKWLMWKCIHLAKEMGLNYIYLGNGYLEKSLYKSRDFSAIEYYNGNIWSSDQKSLQQLCIEDAELKSLDDFKLKEDQNTWLQNWLENQG